MTDVTTTDTAAAAAAAAVVPEVPANAISLRAPSKYVTDPSKPSTTTTNTPFAAPTNEWLSGTWAVTHSTLSMWRSAQNVRITYAPRKPAAAVDSSAPAVNDNLVEYENKSGKGGVKTVLGVEKPDPVVPAAWNWRGKGWLVIASSHWEILGWGERPLADGAGGGVERWAVTWFAPTLFTEEGLDLYSDRKEGLQEDTARDIIAALKTLKAPKLVQLVEKKMMEVAIQLPWKEGSK